jgi:DNA-directed RNA polymerase specialized sigma subunit
MRSLRGRHYLRGGTSGRARPSGDMTQINQLMLKLNRRQRVVYQGMVLTEPPLSRAEIARKLGIRHLNQISQILKRAQAKMNKWLSETEQKNK